MYSRRNLPEARARELRDRWLDELMGAPARPDPGKLERRGWVGAPVHDGIEDEYSEGVSRAARASGVEEAIAVCAEPKIEPEGFWVPMEADEIQYFDADRQLRAFLLAPEDLSFCLFHEGDFYWILMGVRSFVERAMGQPVSMVRETFEAYAAIASPYIGRATEEAIRLCARLDT